MTASTDTQEGQVDLCTCIFVGAERVEYLEICATVNVRTGYPMTMQAGGLAPPLRGTV